MKTASWHEFCREAITAKRERSTGQAIAPGCYVFRSFRILFYGIIVAENSSDFYVVILAAKQNTTAIY